MAKIYLYDKDEVECIVDEMDVYPKNIQDVVRIWTAILNTLETYNSTDHRVGKVDESTGDLYIRPSKKDKYKLPHPSVALIRSRNLLMNKDTYSHLNESHVPVSVRMNLKGEDTNQSIWRYVNLSGSIPVEETLKCFIHTSLSGLTKTNQYKFDITFKGLLVEVNIEWLDKDSKEWIPKMAEKLSKVKTKYQD